MAQANRFDRHQARRFYDRFGLKQDRQGFYEDAALHRLIELGDFPQAGSVFELGCGTGRLADCLLSHHLQPSAPYVAVDLSSTMVTLARRRLARWGDRATIQQTAGEPDYARYGGPFDRFVSTYVFDLLCDSDIEDALAAARDCLVPGGRLCTAGLTHGTGIVSSATSNAWRFVHRIRPSLVGGCRPLALAEYLDPGRWRVLHRIVVVSATVPSEVLVAEAV